MMQTGFSMAMRGMPALASRMKNEALACCRPSVRLALKCLAPLNNMVNDGAMGRELQGDAITELVAR